MSGIHKKTHKVYKLLTMKKRFICPEMREHRLRTESMIAASKPVVDIIVPDTPGEEPKNWWEGYLSNSCVKDGAISGIEVGYYKCFRVNSVSDSKCELFYQLKANTNDIVKVSRLNETLYRAEIVDELCDTGSANF